MAQPPQDHQGPVEYLHRIPNEHGLEEAHRNHHTKFFLSYEKASHLAGWSLEEACQKSVQETDKGTPDEWVERSPALLRLTGRHPLNAEPPLDLLHTAGIITPTALHYVRNHGDVPKIDAETYKLTVETGTTTKSFSLAELKEMPSLELALVITCDGNRRKELNMIKHTKGFNFSAGAVGNAQWKGVILHELLKRCGVTVPAGHEQETPLFVCFEGTERLPNGTYGTSLPLEYVMDPTSDILLAYEMDGAPLPPDHGFPLRVVLPGMVGGRMIKWINRITISDRESPSWYHWHDNKVLPSHVTSDTEASSWWNKPEYALYELNVNSVIVFPSHEAVLPCENAHEAYTVKGYAYAGGGRPIVRVEVSIDGGESWEQATIKYPENSLRHGFKRWAWCFWSLDVPKWKFLTLNDKELVVRAWDRGLQGQPERPTWNLLGMGNNSWYRVRVKVDAPDTVTFLHPVQPGRQRGGWMKPKEIHRDGRETLDVETTQGFRPIPMSEVMKHRSKDDCWVVIDGRVYDLTDGLADHPGGAASILAVAGDVATTLFHDIHPVEINRMKEMFCIGTVVEPLPPQQIDRAHKHLVLDPRRWMTATLTKRKEITHDLLFLRFKFDAAEVEAAMRSRQGARDPRSSAQKKVCADHDCDLLGTLDREPSQDSQAPSSPEPNEKKSADDGLLRVGLPTGQHLLLGACINGTFVVRPYTPVRPVVWEEDDGTVDLLIKVYRASGGKPGGKMSTYVDTLQEGATIQMKGPSGAILYHGQGHFTVNGRTFTAQRVSFLAGGTGIAPVYQVMRAILREKDSKVLVSLLDSNHSYDDILLREELQELDQDDRCHLHHTIVADPPAGVQWQYSRGRITEAMMRSHVFPAGPGSVVFVCGPPLMIEKTCYPILEHMGFFTDENVFEF